MVSECVEPSVLTTSMMEPMTSGVGESSLNVADLMRRVLDAKAYAAWIEAYLPALASGELLAVGQDRGLLDRVLGPHTSDQGSF